MFFFFSSRRRHTRCSRDWSSDVCSSDLPLMPLDFVIDRLDALPATRALAEGLPAPGTRLGISGLPGSSPAVLVAALARRLAQRVFVVITPTPTDAERWLADLRTLWGPRWRRTRNGRGWGAEDPHFKTAADAVGTLG